MQTLWKDPRALGDSIPIFEEVMMVLFCEIWLGLS